MTTPRPASAPRFDYPATYRIIVLGLLARDLSDRLEGMDIDQVVSEDGAAVSVLSGELADQSALASVLYSLYELQMTLMVVEQIPPADLPSQLWKPPNSPTA